MNIASVFGTAFASGPARDRRLLIEAGAVAVATAAAIVRVACSTIFASTAPIRDPDVWWVAAAGRDILATGAVPIQNVYSFVDPGHPWIMHEWLFAVPYAALLSRFGPAALDALALGLSLAEFALVLWGTIGRARFLTLGSLAACISVAWFSARFLSARPPGVALLFPLLLTVIAFRPRLSWAGLVALVLVEALWTNAHGSFPLGIALLAVAAVDQPLDRGRRTGAACAAAAVTLINPYGLALHRFVFHYLRGNDGIFREIHQNITEFSPLFRSVVADRSDKAAVPVLGFVVLCMFFRPKHRARAVLCLALLALAILQARHLELAGLVTCLLLVPYLDEVYAERASLRLRAPQWRLRIVLATVLTALSTGLVGFAAAHRSRTWEQWLEDDGAGVHALSAVPAGANLLIPFHWAGRAIWYGRPRGIRVYFDPRNDCYEAATFREFRSIVAPVGDVPADASVRLARAGANAALLPRQDKLAAYLAQDAAWSRVHEDGSWVVYVAK